MFEPGAVMEAIKAYQPTINTMVPTMIGLTMAYPEFSPDRLAVQGLRRLRPASVMAPMGYVVIV